MILNILLILVIIFFSYLVGSFPPSYLIARIFHGVDIRTLGSGSVGSANSTRIFGYKTGMIVGLIDVIKGYVVIYITKKIINNSDFSISEGIFANTQNIVAMTGFFVVLGHCYSLYLKFSGGKGGATTIGVVLAIDLVSGIILVFFWIAIVMTTRFTSLANLFGIILIPVIFTYRIDGAYVTMGIFLIILIYITHRQNISRLFSGKERKLGWKEEITA